MSKIRFRYEKQSDGVQTSFYLYRGHQLVARIYADRWQRPIWYMLPTASEDGTVGTSQHRVDREPYETRQHHFARVKRIVRNLFKD